MTAQKLTAKEKLMMIENSQSVVTGIEKLKEKLRFGFDWIIKNRITEKTEIKPETHICTVGGAFFMTNGELCFTSGLPKTGKSTIIKYVVATALIEEINPNFDYLSIRTNFTKTKNIVYIDTEQNISRTATTLQSVLKIAGLKKCPDNLHYINVRANSISERMEIINSIFEEIPNLYFVVIDGITDLLNGVNDETQSNELIESLMIHSQKCDIPILSVIHETVGGKLRGHIGSQAERKASAVISIKKHKDEKAFSIEPKLMRYGADFDDIYYRFNPDTGTIESVNEDAIKQIKQNEKVKTQKAQDLIFILEKIYKKSYSVGLSEKVLKEQISLYQNKVEGETKGTSDTRKLRNFKKMMDLSLIIYEEKERQYYLNNLEGEELLTEQEPEF